MAAGLDGNVDIGLDLQTKPAAKALDNFKRKMQGTFNGQDAKALDKNIKETEKTIKSLEKEIDKTKDKLKDLSESSTPPKSVQAMQKELEKSEAQMQKLDKEFEALSKEQTDLAARQVPGLTLEQSLSSEQFARFQELDALIIKNGQSTQELQAKIDTLKAKLNEVKGNPQATEEGKKLNRELDEATAELERNKKKYQELTAEQAKFNQVVSGSDIQFKGMQRNLRRVKELVKSAFIFRVITKGFTALRQGIGNVIKQNTQLMSSLNQIKGNLLTAFAPIWETIMPWLQAFLNLLAKVTGYIAAFMNMLLGKSVKASKETAKALNEQAQATSGAGKATEDAEKSMMDFDTINTIATPKDSGGGGGGASTPTFETTDVTISDELLERLNAILVLVGSIGGALALWKLTDFITGLTKSAEGMTKLTNGCKTIGGILMIVAGAILLVKGYTDAWVNGIDWGNFALILGGIALLIGGIALAISPAAAAFAAIGAGIAMVVLGIKDFIENGTTFQNILMIIIGLAAVFAAVWFLASAPVALIVVAVLGLIAVFVMLWNKCEGFREFWIGLWEKIQEAATVAWNDYLKPVIDYIWEGITDLWENTLKPLWEEHLKPMLEAIWQKIQELWEQVIQPIIQWIGEKIEWLWNNILQPVIDWVVDVFVELFKNAWDNIKEAIDIAAQFISGIIDSIKDIFTGIIDFITGVFTGDWEKAWEGLKSIFKGIINGIITIFESMINFVINGINKFVGGLDAVVSKVGEIFGADWGVPTIPTVKLPRLAKGTVLPGGKPFAAIVNDQPAGHTNIEAPLDTIVEAMLIALSKGNFGNGGDININFTGNLSQLARILKPEIQREDRRGSTKLVRGGAY